MIAEVLKVQAQGGIRGSRAIKNSPGQLVVIKRKQPWELAKTNFREQKTRENKIKEQESYTCKTHTYREFRHMELQTNKQRSMSGP